MSEYVNAPQIVYEDNHLLVVIKPAMMPVQADSSGDMDLLTYLKGYIKDRYNKPGNVYLGLVHRLDRPVGGLMVFARTSKAAARLSNQLVQRNLERVYTLISQGGPPDSAGELRDYMVKDEVTHSSRVAAETEKGAKLAILRYMVAARNDNTALVAVRLETGRSHQIRVQFASRGWPILNDARYGETPTGEPIALYSAQLILCHPTTGERLEFFSSPLSMPVFNGRFTEVQAALKESIEVLLGNRRE